MKRLLVPAMLAISAIAAEPASSATGAAGMPEPGKDAAVTTAVRIAGWDDAQAAAWRQRVAAAGGVQPAPYRTITGEKQRISDQPPRSYSSRTRLRGMTHLSPGCLDAGSLVIRHGETTYAIGSDVLIDKAWGGLGCASGGALKPDVEVELSYRLSLRRVDALVKAKDGKEAIRAGEPHLTNPAWPALQAGDTLLAHVLVDYHSDGKRPDVFPVLEPASAARTATTGPEKLPRTVAKLKAGEPLTIICWGDSVTEGGDLNPNEKHGDLLAARLKTSHPAAKVQTIAVGGSNSRQWLLDLPEKDQHRRKQEVRFQRILDARPDLVVVEFVNDQWMSKADALKHYRELIIAPLHAIGAEVLLLTPQRNWEGWKNPAESVRLPDGRAYVAALRELGATDPGVGCADAAGRWEHLWKEGLPFSAMLGNGFNHPDVRGHRLFCAEVCKALGLAP